MTKLCQAGLPGKLGRCVIIGGGGPVRLKPHPNREFESEEGDYPGVFVDASIINGIHQTIKGVSDRGTRDALKRGVESAVKAFEKRCGDGTSLTFDED